MISCSVMKDFKVILKDITRLVEINIGCNLAVT